MKVLIFGSGAIGSVLGGFLSKAKNEVVLLGRREHLTAVKKCGLKVSGIWGRHCFRNLRLATCVSDLKKMKPFDLIFLTVKSYDTKRAAREIRSVVSQESVLLTAQNGLGNIEALENFFPQQRIMAARIIFGAELTPGKVRITVCGGDVLVGETSRTDVSDRAKRIAALLNEAGIPSVAVQNIRTHLWAKVIYNCALNPLASLLAIPYGKLLASSETKSLISQIVMECYQTAQKMGVKLQPDTAQGYLRLLFGRLIPLTARHYPSMSGDLKRKRRTEIDAMNGAICRIGHKMGLAVPANEFITKMIRAKETLNLL